MWNRWGLFLYTNSDENSNYGLNLTCSERDINCAWKKAAQTLDLLDKSYSTLLKTDAHPLRKLTLHHPLPSRQSDSCRSEAADGKARKPGIYEFQTGFHLSRKYLHFIVFRLILPSVPYRSEVFSKQPVQRCSNIKVTGGDLSCRGAVRLTVTQLTDSQTTRDPCS